METKRERERMETGRERKKREEIKRGEQNGRSEGERKRDT